MKKFILFISLFLLIISTNSALADYQFFQAFDNEFFYATKIFNPDLFLEVESCKNNHQIIDKIMGTVTDQIKEKNWNRELKGSEGAEIVVTEKGFSPNELTIKLGQKVTWKNERDQLKALVLGMREITSMKSSFLQPSEKFSWKFSKPGTYTYVDGVVIGTTGKIIVRN